MIESQPKNDRNVVAAACLVATELVELWKLGDARIPLLHILSIKKKIILFREELAYVCKK